MMRKVLIRDVVLFMVILLAFAGGVFAQDHFEFVDTGDPYPILINTARLNGAILSEGDEIGVFDGDLCVGNVVLSADDIASFGVENETVSLPAFRANPGEGLPGFTDGNEILYKFWISSIDFEVAVTMLDYEEFMGDGTFGNGVMSVVSFLDAFAAPAMINVDPHALDFGNVYLDAISTMDIEIANDGEMNLAVTVTVIGDGFSPVDPTDLIITGGNSEIFTVTFAPTLEMEYTGEVQITSEFEPEVVTLDGVGYVNRHFYPVDPTIHTHTFTIESAEIIFPEDPENPVSLVAGDEIAVFDDDLCVGSILLEEPVVWPVEVIAYGDNELDVNGFVTGNAIFYRLFNLENEREVTAAATYNDGDEVFVRDGASNVSLLAHFENVTEFFNAVEIKSSITTIERTYRDENNVAALDNFANDGWDLALDVPEPLPPNSHYISTYFPHPEWESLFGDNFMVDVRDGDVDLTNDVKIYDFEVKTDFVGPQVNLVFEIGEDYAEDLGVVLHQVIDDVDVYANLRETAEYSFNTNAIEQTHSLELRLGDATPPVLDITSPADGDTLWTDVVYTPTWTVDDITSIRTVIVYYSTDDGLSWTAIDTLDGTMNGPTTLDWELDPDLYSVYTKLRVYALDWAGNEAFVDTDYNFIITPRERSYDFSENWHLLSLPLMLEESDVDELFGDIGPFWVYDYSADEGYDFVQDIYHGFGYWLAISQGFLLTVDGMPELESAELDLSTDWNIVGAALPTTVAKEDLMFDYDGDAYGFVEAVDAGLISPNLYAYNNPTRSYVLTNDLAEWNGYWLHVIADGVQMITYPPYPGPHAEGWVEAEEEGDELDEFDNNNWFVPIVVNMNNAFDYLAGFGINEEATDAYDVWHDVATPPVKAERNRIRVTFNHADWNAATGSLFSRDIRGSLDEGTQVWNAVIEATHEGTVTVNFEDIANIIPDGYNVTVRHAAGTENLLDSPTFSFDYTEPYEISIRVSDVTSVEGEFAGVPSEFAIVSAYPNPFNPTVNVTVAVPEMSNLTAVIYDLMGREVAVLESGMVQAGYHNMTWHAEGPSGIYFIRVSSNDGSSAVQKLMFLK